MVTLLVSNEENATTRGNGMGQLGFFDVEKKLQALSELGDHLGKLALSIDRRRFRPIIAQAFSKVRKSHADRPPFDYVMMFKIMILQHIYNLSDAQSQFQLIDRFSFRRLILRGRRYDS